ncbi:MAG: YceI family protein [Bacteroidetes bacterium]|nr:YceI family protein [Bacteroidota bacterium]
MKTFKILITAVLISASSLFAQTNWTFDQAHSNVNFTVTHMIISEVDGNFRSFDGKVVSDGDNFENAKIEFNVDINSINTDNEKRDQHLKSDDFFNAEKFPKMLFKSKSLKKESGKNWKMVGDLTIRDVTKEITLDVKFNGTIKDPWGNTRAGFKLTGELDRFDYNLKWNSALETGGLVVSKEVEITANIELIQSK